MENKHYTIGIDIGTTSTKAVLYDKALNVVDSSYETYALIQTVEGMAEQNPDEIFEAVLTSVREMMLNNKALKEKINYVSFSSAMHSVIFLDENNERLTNSITWADNRSAKMVDQLKKTDFGKGLYKKTGTPVHTMTPLSKILWLKETEPLLFNQTRKIIGIKEYILYKLTGKLKVDYSIASATSLLNIHDLDWDQEILDHIGIDDSYLPDLVDVTYKWKSIVPRYSTQMHLGSNTSLMIGASDGCLSNLGVGATQPSETAITIGTSGAIRMVTDRIVLDPKGRTFCYYLAEGKWVIGGAVNNGGNVMPWLNEVLFQNEREDTGQELFALEKLNVLARAVAPGADGLFFYPYLNGERAPLWDTYAKGSYVGLTSFHETSHLIRAAMEGVLFNLYEVWQLIQEVGGKSSVLKVTGGFLNSPIWKQMLADIFGETIYLPASFESSCLGAVMLGRDDYDKKVLKDEKVQANPLNTKKYHEIIPVYQEMAEHIKQMNQIMARTK